ncbi:T9SS type A sorting domain-containing protein [Flavobacterium sp.]|uniref:T9SS type A sorting domain-containing protein n=1 Tax=Flavobacterium sp. TaxID=239 RepID=UPI00286DFB57|nr:T9SS type A sorting domain-containing protein [Flavobacterium sp.]
MRKKLFLLVVLFIAYTSNAAIYYVKQIASGTGDGSSWANASSDLQGAINLATTGDDVWVQMGVYLPTLDVTGNIPLTDNREKTFLVKSGVSIYGGFNGTETQLISRNPTVNLTVLTGDIGTTGSNTDNSYHVVTSNNPIEVSLLDGFTIQDGKANGISDFLTISGANRSGGGVFIKGTTGNFTISKCIIKNNSALGDGGGIYNLASGLLDTITILDNAASKGGGIYNNGTPTLFYLSIVNNISDFGGGMYNVNSPSLNNVLITDNYADINGGGIYNLSSSPTLNNVTLSNNDAFLGGAIYNNISASSVLTNVLIIDNFADSGAGIYNRQSSPTLINVTIHNNSADANGGGLYNFDNSNPILKNCIIWGNTGGSTSGIFNSTSTPTMSNSNIQGIVVTGSNISTNPLFMNNADPNGADNVFMTSDDGLQLSCGSPSFNTGNNTSTTTLDILNNPRRQFTIADMGAYESTLDLAVIPAGLTSQTISITSGVDATISDILINPTNAVWYSTLSNALAGTNSLPSTTIITDGSTYYAVNIVGSCSSAPLAVTVTFTLGKSEFNDFNFRYSPNPTTSILNISYSNNISDIIVTNILGQQIIKMNSSSNRVQLDLSSIPNGTYFVKVISENKEKIVKVIKQN